MRCETTVDVPTPAFQFTSFKCSPRGRAVALCATTALGLCSAHDACASATTLGPGPSESPSVTPQAIVDQAGTFLDPPSSGTPFISYDTATGDAVFRMNGFVRTAPHTVCEVDVFSSQSTLRVSGVSLTAAPQITRSPSEIDYQMQAGFDPEIADGTDMGTIFPVNADPSTLSSGDFSSALYLAGIPLTPTVMPFIRFVPTPEPTGVGVVALGIAASLRRRRRTTPA